MMSTEGNKQFLRLTSFVAAELEREIVGCMAGKLVVCELVIWELVVCNLVACELVVWELVVCNLVACELDPVLFGVDVALEVLKVDEPALELEPNVIHNFGEPRQVNCAVSQV